MKKTILVLLLCLITNIAYGQDKSSGTVVSAVVLTKEQIDINTILSKSTDTITAIKLSIKNDEYIYLKDNLINIWAITELNKEVNARRKKLGRGYAGHIYDNQIQSRVKDIDSKIITMPTEIIKDEVIKSTYTVVTSTKSGIGEGGFSLIELMGIIAVLGGLFLLLTKLGIPLWLIILILVVVLGIIVLLIKNKRKGT